MMNLTYRYQIFMISKCGKKVHNQILSFNANLLKKRTPKR